MRRYRIPSALLSGRLFRIFLDQKLSDLNGGGQMAMQHYSRGLQTSVSESVSSGRFLPVTGSFDGEARSLSVSLALFSPWAVCRRGTLIEAKFVQALAVDRGGSKATNRPLHTPFALPVAESQSAFTRQSCPAFTRGRVHWPRTTPCSPASAVSNASRLASVVASFGCASGGWSNCTRATSVGAQARRSSVTLKHNLMLNVQALSPAGPKSQAGSPSVHSSRFRGSPLRASSGGGSVTHSCTQSVLGRPPPGISSGVLVGVGVGVPVGVTVALGVDVGVSVALGVLVGVGVGVSVGVKVAVAVGVFVAV